MKEKNPNIDDVLRLIDIETFKKGWKRTNLVEALGKTNGWLSKIMSKDRGLSVQALLDIAKVLGIEPTSLIPSNENKIPHKSLDEYIRKIVKEEIKKIK